jgi:hypothetical protein
MTDEYSVTCSVGTTYVVAGQYTVHTDEGRYDGIVSILHVEKLNDGMVTLEVRDAHGYLVGKTTKEVGEFMADATRHGWSTDHQYSDAFRVAVDRINDSNAPAS